MKHSCFDIWYIWYLKPFFDIWYPFLISHTLILYLISFLDISLPFSLPSSTWHPLCIPVLPVVQICQIALQRNFSCFIWNTRFVIVSSSEIQNSFFICSRNYISVSHEGHWAVRNCFHGCLPGRFEYYAWAWPGSHNLSSKYVMRKRKG